RDVVLHLLAPLLEAGLPELAAVSGRAAEVHLQHGVAAVRQELRLGVVAPLVAGRWPAVWIDDERQVLAAATRKREIAMNGEAIARPVADRFHLDQLLLVEPRRDFGELGEPPGRRFIEIADTRSSIAPRRDHEDSFVLVVALQVDLVAG